MGRLTWKNPDGTWGLNNMDIREVPGELYGAVCKLKDYEETGLMPEQLVEMDELYSEKCKEAAKLQKELEAYRAIGAVEECWEAIKIKKDVTENVNMQLIAGKNNYKEVYDSFYKIAAIVQKATDNGSST